MLSTPEFKEFSKEFVMFCHITTQLKDRKDDDLLGRKGGRGFPYLVALDENGDVIAQAADRSVEGFRSMMADGAKFVEVRAKPEKTLDDEVFLLKHDIRMGNADLAAAKARMEKLQGLSDAQKKELDDLLLGLEIQSLLPKARDEAEQKAQAVTAGRRFAELWAAGREPTDDRQVGAFFSCMLEHAEAAKDAALFEKALEKLRAKFGAEPRTKPFFDKQEERLAKLKSGGEEPKKDEPGPEGGDK